MKHTYLITTCLWGMFSLQGVAAVPGFESPATYITGANPTVSVAADLNNDGSDDLVSANYGDASVSVFINNGDGSFADKVDYTAGDALSGTQVVNTGDMDSDGDIDIIVSNYDGKTINILWNNGDATFTVPTLVVNTDVNPGQLVSADFNDDGHQDFAFATDTLFVYLNDGGGNFILSDSHFISIWTWNTVAADLNNDGSIDLAVPDVVGETIQVLFNNGNGTFSAPVSYSTPSPKPLAVVDLNQDASPDLVIGSYLNDTLSVFVNDGAGNFAEGGAYPVAIGDGGVGMATLDYNQDGLADLVVTDIFQNLVSVVMSNGDATLGDVVQYPLSSPLWPASGDFNKDGADDLMVTQWSDNLVSVYLNQPVFINLELKVIKAEVDKNKDEVEFVAQFNMDSLPNPSDKISAKFGDVDLGSVNFGEFSLIKPDIYLYRDSQLELRLNFTSKVLMVERDGVDLTQVDLNSVDIQVAIGNYVGSDNVTFSRNREGDYVYRTGQYYPCYYRCW